jgi:hypothetical protein
LRGQPDDDLEFRMRHMCLVFGHVNFHFLVLRAGTSTDWGWPCCTQTERPIENLNQLVWWMFHPATELLLMPSILEGQKNTPPLPC